MRISGIEFPNTLINALRKDELVVFAGAGVSMGEPSNLPSFRELAVKIAVGTGESLDENETEDQFLGRLEHKGIDVHAQAARSLQQNLLSAIPIPTDLHYDLIRLFNKPEAVRIVTTNFDMLFEQAVLDAFKSDVYKPDVFRAPALPLGSESKGIIHVHGTLDRHSSMVLTDSDFGRAYLTDGWARRFLVDLFRSSVVLFVGYGHNDIVFNYLIRALPHGGTKDRFVLTDDGDVRRWQILGIRPITYRRSGDDHGALYVGIRQYVDYATRTIQDWKNLITRIARNPPSIDDEEMDLVRDAVSDVSRIRLFTDAASSPAWISWLESNSYLDSLFSNRNLNAIDQSLVAWLTNKFIPDNSNDLFLLIGRQGMQLHPAFWLELAREIAYKHPELDIVVMSRWISLLLTTAPSEVNGQDLLELGKRCFQSGLTEQLLEIFDVMATTKVVLNPPIYLFDELGDGTEPQISATIIPNCEHYYINSLWESCLRPNLELVAVPLISRVVKSLTSQHEVLCIWDEANHGWDPQSSNRSAIEPNEQDEFPEPIDALIDVARDSLEWLAQNQTNTTAWWCDQLANSDAPLLRRLAVNTMSIRTDLKADKKVEWLLNHTNIHDLPVHHESFQFLKHAYPNARLECRENVINAIRAFHWPHTDEGNRERLSALQHFKWFHWLHEAAPDCTLIEQALDDVWSQYPDFKPHDYMDFTHWSTVDSEPWYGSKCPWNVGELLSKPVEEWFDRLLEIRPESIYETDFVPERDHLILTVSEAVSRDREWGRELTMKLVQSGNWSTWIWHSLIHSWLYEPDEEKHREAIKHLSHESFSLQNHIRPIADLLYTLVRNAGMPYTPELLSQANKIADKVWRLVDRKEQTTSDVGYEYNEAINHTAGILAEFWVMSLSCWRQNFDSSVDGLEDEYRSVLSEIVEDNTAAGRLAKSVLSRYFSFLLESDEAWTLEKLLPVLSECVSEDNYRAAWDGFLYGSLNPHVAEVTEEAFLNAVTRFETTFSQSLEQERFIDAYVHMLMYYIKEPIVEWIPKFFDNGSCASRTSFASAIRFRLGRMDESTLDNVWKRWLNTYWQNRLLGVPVPLVVDEIEEMLEWLPDMKDMFPYAVELAVKMPTKSVEFRSPISRINEGELWEKFPKSTALLLVFLSRCRSPVGWYKGKELIDKLLTTDISNDIKQDLEELTTHLGLN